jgi:ATP-dependent DNA helicase RecQ
MLSGDQVQATPELDVSAAADAAAAEQAKLKEGKAERLRQMQEYADKSGCRREHLLQYFGDDFTGPCGNCDNCQGAVAGDEPQDIPVDPSVGTRREVA